ncbi:MAG: hypothetical protein ABI192_11340 [Bradyrhizobium sp.]
MENAENVLPAGSSTALNYADFAVQPSAVRDQTPLPAGFFADIESFKLDMQQAGLEGAEEQLATVTVRKPPATDFVRVHPGKEKTIAVALYEGRNNFTTEYYLIMPKMIAKMLETRDAFYARLHLTVTRTGSVMLWPVKLPTGGASNPWFESALRGAEIAKSAWIRIFADAGQGQYRIMKAVAEFDAPEFPERTLGELLEIAFSGRVIDSPDHPVCRKQRGEV